MTLGHINITPNTYTRKMQKIQRPRKKTPEHTKNKVSRTRGNMRTTKQMEQQENRKRNQRINGRSKQERHAINLGIPKKTRATKTQNKTPLRKEDGKYTKTHKR